MRITEIMRIVCVLSPQRPIKFNQTRTWLPVSIGKRNSLKYRQLGRFNSSKNRNLRKKKRDTDCVSSVRKIPQHLRDNGRFCSWKDELREGQWAIYAGNNTQRQHTRSCRLHSVWHIAISSTGYDGSGICVHGRAIGIDIGRCIAEAHGYSSS